VDDLRLTVAEALSDLLCPKCSARMATVNPDDHAELAIERCPSCHGLWLDAGELARLHEIAVTHAAAQSAGLHQRPDGWSHLRWASYRVAEHWHKLS
jgi:Zn-finger nucleic acid-binding protein